MGYYWSEEEVREKMTEKMVEAFENVYTIATTRNIDMRLSCVYGWCSQNCRSITFPWLGIILK